MKVWAAGPMFGEAVYMATMWNAGHSEEIQRQIIQTTCSSSLWLVEGVSIRPMSCSCYYSYENIVSIREHLAGHKVLLSRGSWGNAESRAMPKIAIVQKQCHIEATCRLPYEALGEASNVWLPQNKSKCFRSTRPSRTFQRHVFHYLLMHEKLNYSLSMWLFPILCRV